jgi:hypothetical protein
MRMPMMAVAPTRLFLLLATVGLVACAADTTAPASAPVAGGSSLSPLSPNGASHSLVGASDGEYTFVVDPNHAQTLAVGLNFLQVPENAICRLSDSGYGPGYWDDKCRPERDLVTITAIVRNANTDHPRIDFEPALRFAPGKEVMLYMTLDNKIQRADWSTILYCNTDGREYCVDEAKDDHSLTTSVRGQVISRRIKHFSGYTVTSRYQEAM